jgi:hypothetical protein
MKSAAQLEHRASSSRSKHEGESSFALCDRLSRTRDNSQRQLPTDQDYAVPTREYQTDQSSLKTAPTAARSILEKQRKQRQQQKKISPFTAVDTVTPYQGYTLVITNIRGGAEYGKSWHLGGNLNRKQNVFDDFSACAQYLIDNHWSSPAHMAAIGGSNGGLLIGAEITQHPEQFHVVVSYVGIYDMLRVELDPNGQFNTTEYGTVKNPTNFRALYAYSSYHHVVDGTK